MTYVFSCSFSLSFPFVFSSAAAFRLSDLRFLSRLKDSLRDFLNDFRRDIGVSDVPVTSMNIKRI